MAEDGVRRLCVACGGETVAAEIGMPPTIRPARSEDGDFRLAGVPMSLRVCTGCGRVEMYVKDLEPFR